MYKQKVERVGNSDKMKMWKSAYPDTYRTSAIRFGFVSAICGLLAILVFTNMRIMWDNRLFYVWFGILCIALFAFFLAIAVAWNREYKRLLASGLYGAAGENKKELADYKISFINQYRVHYIDGERQLILDIGKTKPILLINTSDMAKWNGADCEPIEEKDRVDILNRIYGLLMYGANPEYTNVRLNKDELRLALKEMNASDKVKFNCEDPEQFALNEDCDQWQVIINGEKSKSFDREEDACGFIYKKIAETNLQICLPEQSEIWDNSMFYVNRSNKILIALLIIILAAILFIVLFSAGSALYFHGYSHAAGGIMRPLGRR